jgi:transcription initiation factor TFIID subunit 2
LDTDKYDTVEAFEADMVLMVQNAITFNGTESEVGSLAAALRDRVQELMENWKSGATKKRKDGEKGTPQPTKKVKVG